MTKFAFVIHPLHPKQIAKKYRWARFLPDNVLESLLRYKSPSIASHIHGIESITGAKTEGIFVICPLTPALMVQHMKVEKVYERIIECCELAAKEGAQIIGLGAFTSVVGDGGITIAKHSPIPVTTGNSYTVATAIEGALKASEILGIKPAESTLAVVGATGSIGKTCAQVLAPQFHKTALIGRDLDRTAAFAETLPRAEASVNMESLKDADVVITVTSTDAAVIMPQHLKKGSIVVDVARPRDVSVRVSAERPDVLVIEGGVVRVPGPVDFGVDFGFPPQTAYACMSETIMLALDGRMECFTLGKDVSIEQVNEIQRLAAKHGFKLDSFRSFEREVSQESIERARQARQELMKFAHAQS